MNFSRPVIFNDFYESMPLNEKNYPEEGDNDPFCYGKYPVIFNIYKKYGGGHNVYCKEKYFVSDGGDQYSAYKSAIARTQALVLLLKNIDISFATKRDLLVDLVC